MHHGEEEGGAGADFVELEVGVEGDVLVKGELLQLGDQILTDGEEEEAVAEGEGVGSAPVESNVKNEERE
jgi:hypothetical protein